MPPEQEFTTPGTATNTMDKVSSSPSNLTSNLDSVADAAAELNSKRKGRMSKVRGLLSGKSWREKRQKKKLKTDNGEGDEDGSTLYGVQVDENAQTAAAMAKSLLGSGDEDHEETDLFNEHAVGDKKYLLKIVLLLMDAKSRRFELLQLEFDSVKASVADVLAQIPVAVTEDCLQDQSYVSITSCDGQEKKQHDILANFCKGGDVMVAIAQGMTAADCVKLALPILADNKVMQMLRASGIDSSPWKEAKKKARSDAKREKGQQKSGSIKSSPSKTAPETAPAKKASQPESKSRSIALPGQINTHTSTTTKSKASPVITFHPNNDTPHSITPGGGIHVSKIHATGKSTKAILSIRTFLTAILVGLLMAGLIKAVDMYLKSPIQVGQVLAPGTVRHKCGLAGLIPGVQAGLSAISSDFDCENTYLKVKDEVVNGYDKDGNVKWTIQGTHHSSKKYCDVDNEVDCKRGLHYLDNKHLIMSGTKITWIEVFQKGLDMDPWPFVEKPLARVWRKKAPKL